LSKPSDEQLQKIGQSLREIDPTTLIPDEEGARVRWFLGDNGTEIFAWNHGPAPAHHIQMVFSRVSVEWVAQTGLTTGTFATGSSTAGGRYDPYLLTVGSNIDPEVCRAALVLLGTTKIDEAVSGPLIKALEAALSAPGDRGPQ
jgi:hypothetical protein